MTATVEQLRKLALLREKGALTDVEYDAAKLRLLDTVPDAEETGAGPDAGHTRTNPPDAGPLLAIAILSAIILALFSMLVFGASLSMAGTIGVATLGAATILLYRGTDPES